MKQGHSKPPPPDIYIRLGTAFMFPADTGAGSTPPSGTVRLRTQNGPSDF